jgi:hypothetical protein
MSILGQASAARDRPATKELRGQDPHVPDLGARRRRPLDDPDMANMADMAEKGNAPCYVNKNYAPTINIDNIYILIGLLICNMYHINVIM